MGVRCSSCHHVTHLKW
ncbi:hypothetical protein AB0H49_23345 [Nocardia sp. NPDC050713]